MEFSSIQEANPGSESSTMKIPKEMEDTVGAEQPIREKKKKSHKSKEPSGSSSSSSSEEPLEKKSDNGGKGPQKS